VSTEPPHPTERIPNRRSRERPSRAVSSRSARASAHRDRTRTEPWLLSPVGLTVVIDRRILPLTRRSRHAHLPPPVKRTHQSNSLPVWVHSRATSDRDVARTLARRRASLRRLLSPRLIRASHGPDRARPVDLKNLNALPRDAEAEVQLLANIRRRPALLHQGIHGPLYPRQLKLRERHGRATPLSANRPYEP